MKRTNCPNCGAPINEVVCPYCGTVFYDFTAIDSEKPTYICMNMDGKQFVFRALMVSANIDLKQDEYPLFADNRIVSTSQHYRARASIEFMILQDDEGVLMKVREKKDDD